MLKSSSQVSHLFDRVVENSAAHIALIDDRGTIVFTNEAWNRFGQQNGALEADWLGVNYMDVCRKSGAAGDTLSGLVLDALQQITTGKRSSFEIEYPCHSPEISRWFLMRAIPIVLNEDRFICIYHERFIGDTELQISQKRLQLATDAGNIGIWDLDIVTDALVWDTWMYRIYGVEEDEFLGAYEAWVQGVHPGDIGRAEEQLKDAVATHEPFDSEFRVVRPSGEIRHVMAKARVYTDDEGVATKIIGVNIDITERKRAEEEIRKLAFYDHLTNTPNRTVFIDRLCQEMAASDRTASFSALLFIDLDNFKLINDTAGHEVGDELLIQVARRLEQTVRDEDTVSRFGGDEFVILLNRLSENKDSAARHAKSLSQVLLAIVREPYDLSVGVHSTTASIGISLFRGMSVEASEIMRRADLAMYKAKGSGRNTIHFFDPAMQREVLKRVDMEKDMSAGFADGQFMLYYQPQIGELGGLIGAEALLRWRHPQRGFVSPAEFIPLAEETGLIIEIGTWVINTACEQLIAWGGRFGEEFTLAVNVSAAQLFDKNFVSDTIAVVEKKGVRPSQLKLELTESLLVKDIELAIQKMTQLKNYGFSFSMDDFGTGYSSLAYLKKLPIDQLKIDQSFVRDLLDDPNDSAIAKSVIALADSLSMSVIAEGVETEAHRLALNKMGCTCYQGYLFSPAISGDNLVEYYEEFRKDWKTVIHQGSDQPIN